MLQGRIQTRGRDAEKSDDEGGGGVDASYLLTLHRAHDKFFDTLGAEHPKRRINACVGPELVANSVREFISQLLGGDETEPSDLAAPTERACLSPAAYKISSNAESPTSVIQCAPLPVLEAAALSS